MPGFSLTIFLLPGGNDADAPSTDLLLALLDDPADTPGWKWSSRTAPARAPQIPQTVQETATAAPAVSSRAATLRAPDVASFNASIARACNALVAAEPEITRMDSIAGDGDCGLTLKDGASGEHTLDPIYAPHADPPPKGVLKALEQGSITGEDVVGSMIAISKVAEEAMGGTSGALYSYVLSLLLSF